MNSPLSLYLADALCKHSVSSAKQVKIVFDNPKPVTHFKSQTYRRNNIAYRRTNVGIRISDSRDCGTNKSTANIYHDDRWTSLQDSPMLNVRKELLSKWNNGSSTALDKPMAPIPLLRDKPPVVRRHSSNDSCSSNISINTCESTGSFSGTIDAPWDVSPLSHWEIPLNDTIPKQIRSARSA